MKSAIQLLRERGLRAKKALGQNFLLDEGICGRIVDGALAGTDSGQRVIEIGPGLGALTNPLLARGARVTAIERDVELASVLRDELAPSIASGALDLVEGDALKVDLVALMEGAGPVVLIGNLPYLITGKLIERAIEVSDRLVRAVFMVQAEVADRLVAAPSAEAYGALSVFTQAAFGARKLLTVRGGAFHPRPDVDSTVVVLTPDRPRRAIEDDPFRAVVKGAFGVRRKTLRNAWRGLFASDDDLRASAEAAGIDLVRRGETLSVEEFDRMAGALRRRSVL